MAASASIGALLQGSTPLAHLSVALRQRQRLLEAVRALLPPDLRSHCLGASREADQLTLVTEAPVWATRLRFATPALLVDYAQRGDPLTRIQIRIAPPTAPAAVADVPAPVTRPGPDVATHLEAVAASLGDDALARSLAHLAGTLRAARQTPR